MFRTVIAIYLVLTAFSTVSAKSTAPQVGHHVLVAKGARLFPTARGGKGQKFDRPLSALEVVAVKGSRAAIRETRRWGCYAVPKAFKGYELTLWVERKSLRKVLTKGVTHTYKDGTGYTLAPGLVVKGRSVELGYGRQLKLAKAPRDVGVSYPPSMVKGHRGKNVSVSKPTLGGRPIHSINGWQTSPTEGIYVDGELCSRLRARGKVMPSRPALLGAGSVDEWGLGAKGKVFRGALLKASKGSAIYWPTGEPVGRLSMDLRYVKQVGSSKRGPCWRSVWSGFTLCGEAQPQPTR